MKILIAGGSGMIGSKLIPQLLKEHHEITIISRDPASYHKNNRTDNGPIRSISVKVIGWDTTELDAAVSTSDVVINLCGASIGKGLWTKGRKRVLKDSRLKPAQILVEAIESADHKPKVFLQASATGYYGTDIAGKLDESVPSGHDFLADLCVRWEQSLIPLEQYNIRTVILRSSAVLDRHLGAFPLLKRANTFHVGGNTGSGRQYFSWIHMTDEVNAILQCMTDDTLSGPVNLSAPEPVTNQELMTTISALTNKKMQIPGPAFLIRFIMGEKALIYLKGQQAVPKKLLASGFEFTYPSLHSALSDLLH